MVNRRGFVWGTHVFTKVESIWCGYMCVYIYIQLVLSTVRVGKWESIPAGRGCIYICVYIYPHQIDSTFVKTPRTGPIWQLVLEVSDWVLTKSWFLHPKWWIGAVLSEVRMYSRKSNLSGADICVYIYIYNLCFLLCVWESGSQFRREEDVYIYVCIYIRTR